MKAFTDTEFTKAETLAQLEAHAAADELVQGHYWENGKGCAVGCLTHNPDGGHEQFPSLFGLPEWFAQLIDSVFEGLPVDQAKGWPLRVMSAVPEGAVIDEAFADRLAVARLRETMLPLQQTWPESVRGEVVNAVEGVIEALENDGDRSAAGLAAESAWSAARSAAGSAWSAAWAAESAAELAAGSAAGSAASAAWAAGSAWSAAGSAWSAAWVAGSAGSAGSAAWSAAWSAGSAGSAGSAAWAAEADRIINQLEGAKS